jgi:TRAP-type C4-dicarboxylate transport system permease small subunit
LVLFVAGWEYAYVAYAADQHSATLLSVPLYLPRAAIPLGAISLMAQALVNLLTNEYPETNEAPIAVAAE